MNSTMEKFRKSVNIYQSYGQKYRGPFLTHSVYTMQIMTGIEVNSEADFPKLREYCPSAEGTRATLPALGQYSRN